MQHIIKALSALFVLTTFLASQVTTADWSVPGPTNENPQNVVIIVSENPKSNPERTCLAVTLANALKQNPLKHKLQNVTIFATLDGTALGVASIVQNPRFKCAQQDGREISLQENLEKFLGCDEYGGGEKCNQNHMLLCPICYRERFGDEPQTYGVLPGDPGVWGLAVVDVLANADKVIDF